MKTETFVYRAHYRDPQKYNLPVVLTQTIETLPQHQFNEFLTMEPVPGYVLKPEILTDAVTSFAKANQYQVIAPTQMAKYQVDKVTPLAAMLHDNAELDQYLEPQSKLKLRPTFPVGLYVDEYDYELNLAHNPTREI